MPKFKVGEIVKCLPVQPERHTSSMGAGFIAGGSFKVKKITFQDTNDPIYWPTNDGNKAFDSSCGVYEHELEEHDWDG